MTENPLKRKLASGGTSVGLIVFEFATTGIGRLAAAAGAEFVMLDMEHSGLDIGAVRTVLAAVRGTGVVPLVRVPSTEYHFVARALDAGALGIMVPMVECADQARDVVRYAKFPPLGGRGVGVYYPDDIDQAGLAATTAQMNRETLLIAQIETTAGVDSAGQIAAVDGIDVLWVGHFDLTTSLGISGEFWHPRHAEAVDRVLAAARAHNKPVGSMANDVADGRMLVQRGFRALAIGDSPLFFDSLRESVAAISSQQ